MDPFEARLLLQQMLKTLTSSSNNNSLIANFLLLHQELQEDLHSCILEALNVDDLNYKVNLFQLIDMVIQRSMLVVPERPYIKNLVRDFDLIVTKVLSPGASARFGEYSALNLSSTFTILVKISKLWNFSELKKYQLEFRNATVTRDEIIEVSLNPVENRLDKEQMLHSVWELILLLKKKSKQDRLKQQDSSTTSGSLPATAFSSKSILRRMEDDRERTKKLKETLWENVGGSSSLRDEFNELMSKCSSSRSDFKDMVELNGIVGQCYNDWTSNSIISRK